MRDRSTEPFQRLIHVLVANTFIEKIDPEKDTVNHKNGNKLNNDVENLEWTTDRENGLHAHATGLVKEKREHEFISKERYEELRPWSTIKGFPDYEISWFGYVINIYSKLILKTRGTEYQRIDLRNYKSKKVTFQYNRLICEAFLPPPRWYFLPEDKSLQIRDNFNADHLNRDKQNNCTDNLYFKPHQENCLNRVHKQCIKIKMFNDEKEEFFDSIVDCIKKYPEFKHQGIYKVVIKKRDIYKRFHFEKV
jgi:hypothetical protein